MRNRSSGNLLLAVVSCLERAGARCEVDWRGLHVRLLAGDQLGPLPVVVGLDTSPALLTVSVALPVAAGRDRAAAFEELAARANFGLHLSRILFDAPTGRLHAVAALPLHGGSFVETQFLALFNAALYTAETYTPAFLALRDGRLTPKEAIDRIEREPGFGRCGPLADSQQD